MKFSKKDVQDLAYQYYGLSASVRELGGYDELNYLLTDEQGVKYVLKIADESQDYHFLDAQVKILGYLNDSLMSNFFPKYYLNSFGNELTELHYGNEDYYLRILSYLDGIFWVDQSDKPNCLYTDLGFFLGRMDRTLKGFSHPALHRHHTWDLSTAFEANSKLKFITDHERRRIAGYFLLQFETEVMEVLPSLRHAYVHNDTNDYNVLINNYKVTGLIDFGDMVYTALINNLAIACTYAMFNTDDPLYVASLVVKGYNEIYPLDIKELDLLYYLIAARLCISVCQSAYNASLESHNEHHFVSETYAWDLLFKLIRINPIKAQDMFRRVCGYDKIIRPDDHTSLLNSRRERIGYNLSISYNKPLKIVKGALQYLYDDKGRTFVDCVNNPSHVGHCHPVVVKKMQKQIATLNTNTRYLSDIIVEYAQKLTKTLPPSLNVCYFVNSGSEAVDLAIRMSRNFTKQKDVVVLDHAYHGTSTVAMELSPYKFDGKGGFGKMAWIHKAKSPDLYRGDYKYNDDNAGAKYAEDVLQIIERLEKEGKSPAAFICETLLGVGGQLPLPQNYLKDVYDYVRKAGGVCIADEVQTGFGRVGEKFWGFELQDVVPDIVIMGKPIGNGHPLGAVVVTEQIAQFFNNGLEYFNTFGGNPVSMTAGLAVLNVIHDEDMQQHALEIGNFLMDGLNRLKERYSIIGDVRGHGLFLGAEMIKDRKTLEPATDELNTIIEKMKEEGFLLSSDGPFHNVLKIKPPLPFSKKDAEAMLFYLDKILEEINS